MSPGTRMPGLGSGGRALLAATGSGPKAWSGSGAGCQGGPAETAAPLAADLALFGGGAMAGLGHGVGAGDGGWDGCISPRPPPCQPPAAVQLGPGGPGSGRSCAGAGWPGPRSGLRCLCCPWDLARADPVSTAAAALVRFRRARMTMSSTTRTTISPQSPATT
jgi:hypothetical protein